MKNSFEHYRTLAAGDKPFVIDDSWRQGANIFGGLNAALIINHIEARVDLADHNLQTLLVQYIGKINKEQEVSFSHKILSLGKYGYHIQGFITQGGAVKTTVLAFYTKPRNSHMEMERDYIKPPVKIENAKKFKFVRKVVPNYFQHLDVRSTLGDDNLSGAGKSLTAGYIRLKEAPVTFSNAALITLIDVWPPLRTITWNIEFIHPRPDIDANDHLYYEYETVSVETGY